ncbi:MAG: SDR family oxidoreductase [Fibrobacteria bacterium]
MRVLFIGGTGIISSGCTQAALEKGWDVTLFNRGSGKTPQGATQLHGDVNDRVKSASQLKALSFDAVVDFVAYQPEDIERDIELFRDKTGHYIFISSASAYFTPAPSMPIQENSPLGNPVWKYSRDKIACEARLLQAVKEEDFPGTIVRPSHTYNETYIPLHGGYTVIDRMLKGLPIVVHGDGTALWTLTHNRDFAKGLLGLMGKTQAIGEAYHITSDEWLTWDQIHLTFADLLNVRPEILHIPSEIIARYHSEWGESLLGDKAFCGIFDNRKIKDLVPDFKAEIPFSQGAREIIDWHQRHSEFQIIDPSWNQVMDSIARDWKKFTDTLNK